MDQSYNEIMNKIDGLLERLPAVKGSWYSSTMGGGFKDTVGYESLVTEVISVITHIYGNGHPHTQRVIYAFNQGSLHALENKGGREQRGTGLREQRGTGLKLGVSFFHLFVVMKSHATSS